MVIFRKKVYEEIADLILGDIKTGNLKPGDRLPSISRMAEIHQVSSASIREALNSLRVMGVIEVKHGQGSFVNERIPLDLNHTFEIITRKDIEDLLDLRKIIEVGCARAASEKSGKEQIDQMEYALEKMQTAVENNELGEEADYEFHMAIAEATDNRMLVNLLEEVSETMLETMKETRRIWLYEGEKSIKKIYEEHKLIFEAVKNRDADAAATHMFNHLQEVKNLLLKHY